MNFQSTCSISTWSRLSFFCFLPLLSGCFEISNLRGKEQVLLKERQELEAQIPIYDQHISYYKTLLPPGTNIVGDADPMYDTLNGYLQKVETELLDLKANMASTDAYLKILREETSREHTLQPSASNP